MRKEMNSKSKKKWIVGGAIFFGSIALLTTGFATWSIGSQITAQDGDVNVTVDTAKNESIVLEAVLDDHAIELKEANVSGGKIVNVTENETVANPLRVTFSTFKITYGADYTFNYTKLVFSIKKTVEGDYANAANYVADAADLIEKRDGTEYTYIEAPVEIAVDKTTAVDQNNNKVITISQTAVDFQWGSFFGGKTPANYYNETFASANQSEIAAQSGNVATELNAMKDALNSKTIQLHIELVA